jgi:hypothetical protein
MIVQQHRTLVAVVNQSRHYTHTHSTLIRSSIHNTHTSQQQQQRITYYYYYYNYTEYTLTHTVRGSEGDEKLHTAQFWAFCSAREFGLAAVWASAREVWIKRLAAIAVLEYLRAGAHTCTPFVFRQII